jgi:DNA-nicking Smr family endonuclease
MTPGSNVLSVSYLSKPERAAGRQEVQVTYYSEGRMLDWTDRRSEADLDLHGQAVLEAVANAERFLRAQGKARPGAVVRVVTGRGSGGGGAPIRTRVRTLLRGMREEGTVVRDYVLEDSEGSFLVRLR